jgi:phosphoglycolate phosphatase-like HAD superfamily hydrolase
MDGTLVNTDYANYLSYRQALKEVTQGKCDIRFNLGNRLCRENLKNQVPQLCDDEYKRIVSLKEGYFKNYISETKLNAALANVLRKYCDINVIALVTNCRKKRVIATLQYHKMLDNFTHVFCRDMAFGEDEINKYENAIIQLSVNPVTVFVFENEAVDIESAVLSGIPKENIISIYE